MPIAKLTIELEIPHAQSLKDRRQVVRSLKDKLRHGFNISVAELDEASSGTAPPSASPPSPPPPPTSPASSARSKTPPAASPPGLGARSLDSYAEILVRRAIITNPASNP